MIRRLVGTVFLTVLFLIGEPFPAAAAPWGVDRLTAVIRVESSGDLLVTEEIGVTFLTPHHGIYRFIPTHGIAVKVLDVTDDRDRPVPYRLRREKGQVTITIGSPSRKVTGRKTYRILYEIHNGIATGSGTDRLIYNVTGDRWPVTIRHAGASIYLPEEIPAEDIKAAFFTGRYGSADSRGDLNIGDQGEVVVAAGPLKPGEGLTASFSWPSGSIRPSIVNNLQWWIWGYGPLFPPLLVLLMAGFIWRRWGRDPDRGRSIMPRYQPPKGVEPWLAGCVVDETVTVQEISAAVIDLATRGYLSIEEYKKGKFFLKKEREWKNDPALAPFEKKLLGVLFGSMTMVTTDLVANKFSVHLQDLLSMIYDEAVNLGYFAVSPRAVRMVGIVIGALVAAGSGAIVQVLYKRGSISSPWWVVSAILSGLIVVLFGILMPRKTYKGARLRWKILGLREYINRAEKDRIRVLTPKNFDAILPFAVALGLTKKWAGVVAAVPAYRSEWYQADYSRAGDFSAFSFAEGLDSVARAINNAFSEVISSGGRSGGGGGRP